MLTLMLATKTPADDYHGMLSAAPLTVPPAAFTTQPLASQEPSIAVAAIATSAPAQMQQFGQLSIVARTSTAISAVTISSLTAAGAVQLPAVQHLQQCDAAPPMPQQLTTAVSMGHPLVFETCSWVVFVVIIQTPISAVGEHVLGQNAVVATSGGEHTWQWQQHHQQQHIWWMTHDEVIATHTLAIEPSQSVAAPLQIMPALAGKAEVYCHDLFSNPAWLQHCECVGYLHLLCKWLLSAVW